MKMPEPVWEMDYSHDRRAHRHRCLYCNKIVNADERVWMAKTLLGTYTKVLHAACAEMPHGTPGQTPWTMLDGLRRSGLDYLASTGWSQAAEEAKEMDFQALQWSRENRAAIETGH